MSTQALKTRLYHGNGEFSISKLDANSNPIGFISIGNLTQLTVRPSVEMLEHRENLTGRNYKDVVLERTTDVEISFTAESTAINNLLRYFYGKGTQLGTATISSEQVKGYKGYKAKLARINLSSFTSLTNAAGTLTLTRDTGKLPFSATYDATADEFTANGHGLTNGTRVHLSAGTMPTGFTAATNYFVIGAAANTFQLSATFGGSAVDGSTTGSGILVTVQPDYKVNLKSGVIEFNLTGNFTNGDILLANYAAGTSEIVAGFAQKNENLALLFEGLNFVENDAPVVFRAHRARLMVPSEWAFINDEFATFEVSGQLLLDPTKPEDAVGGQFFSVEQTQSAEFFLATT